MRLLFDPAALHDTYVAARPFPHAVIDGLFEDDAVKAVLDHFPSPGATDWARFDNRNERKLGFHHERTFVAPTVRAFLEQMNSFEMLLFLETLTGIEGLIPDPYFGGGGLHQIEQGGFLGVHVDFNVHPKLHLHRRLNLLLYLNRGWREEYGGHLELWNADASVCETKILPVFNRTVIFSTTETSFHGHPHPLTCPDGWTRKSVSLYYYTCGRAERSPRHDTIFVTE
ncbi:MAG TPA: 2OG-Fe(II) oxygenase [Thermoanaerobaculia bacterium]|nr:2OG-Fe(II) oxygenase [Thermoanaerobaculia bacterium]